MAAIKDSVMFSADLSRSVRDNADQISLSFFVLSCAQKLKGSDNKSLPFRSSLQLFEKITLQHP